MEPASERAQCDYCALPIDLPITTHADDEPHYCCFGCRFAAAVAGERAGAAESSGAQLRLGLAVFFTMNVMVFTMFLWSQPETVVTPSNDAAAIMYDVARYLCLLFALPVLFLLGPTLISDAAAGLRQRRIESSLLLLIGVLASFAYSVHSVFYSHGHIYFEVGVIVLVVATLGRWLEAQGKLRTTQALRELRTLLPNEVRQWNGQQDTLVPLQSIMIGDCLRILPGERIAVDGRVLHGRAAVDEQMVTGESLPVEKESGDLVYSGTLNLDGELIISATATPAAGALQRLIDSVMAAVSKQASYQRLADKIAAWFLPTVSLIALSTFVIHFMVRYAGTPNAAWEQAILAAMAVVVISCPCALGLATPLALWAAIGRAAQHQVLFRHGDALARLARAKVICFDKTGTLTTGQLEVADVWTAPNVDKAFVWELAFHLAQKSNHPASQAVARFTAEQVESQSIHLSDIREIPGRGLQSWCSDFASEVCLGNSKWLHESEFSLANWEQFSQEHPAWHERSVVLLAWRHEVQAAFAFQEEIRPEALRVIHDLKALGLQVMLLTGDRLPRAKKFSQLFEVEVAAELLPQAKLEQVAQLRQQFGPVVMVGDGLNDAPALAAADIGIALGCGADLSRDAAGVCLLGNQLTRIPWSIKLAREADRTIRWNLFWAFSYNAIGIPLAIAGWVNPIFAAIFMGVSSVLVTTNSLRLTREAISTKSDESAETPIMLQAPARLQSQEILTESSL
jgi:heavy metal translocating P-type ATPase